MTKIYKLIIFFKEKKTLTRALSGEDYACINGELTKCTTTTYNKCYEKYFIGTNKEKLLQKLKAYKKRNAFSDYILEEIKIDELIEL